MSTFKTPLFERCRWATDNNSTIGWVNELIWTILRQRAEPTIVPLVPNEALDATEIGRKVLTHHELQGFVPVVFGELLKKILGNSYYDGIEAERRRTEIFEEELHWLLGPKLCGRIVP